MASATNLSFTNDYATVTREVQSRVHSALNRVQVWLDHPSYDSKPEVLRALRGVTSFGNGVWFCVSEAQDKHMPDTAFAVLWTDYAALVAAVQALGTKSDKGTLTRSNVNRWREVIFALAD